MRIGALIGCAFAVFAAGLLSPSNAFAAKTATGEANEKNDTNRMICRRVDATGSRLQKKRICMTAAEWDAQRSADRQAIERSQTGRWKSE